MEVVVTGYFAKFEISICPDDRLEFAGGLNALDRGISALFVSEEPSLHGLLQLGDLDILGAQFMLILGLLVL